MKVIINNYNDKNNSKRGGINNIVRPRHLILLVGIAVASAIIYAGITGYGNQAVTTDADVLDAAVKIDRYEGIPDNPSLPLQHIELASISSNSKVTDAIAKVNSSFDPRVPMHPSESIKVTSAQARALLQLIPFTYHDLESYPDYEVHSTNIELNGKYYLVIVSLPKTT